jgi:dipeptidyl aminopeptidase/acylaminoacyl peptidase
MNVIRPSRKIFLFKIDATFLMSFLLAVLALAASCSAQKLVKETAREVRQGVAIKNWTYTSDGLLVKGELYLPPGDKKLPLVMFNHDGINGISDEHRKSSVRLAKAGYVVFSASYRGEDGSQGMVEIAKGEVDDVLNALSILKQHSRVQPDKIALVGASHGALISVLAASREKDIKAVVAAYGVMDIYKWYAYLKRVGKLGKDTVTLRTYGPGPQARPKSFAIRNAVSVVSQLSCPLLILQGAQDDTVPEEQAVIMQKAMERAKKKVETKIYPDALHGFLVYAPYINDATTAEKKQTEDAWRTLLDFLKTNL